MSRPILLIKKELLSELYDKFAIGVKYRTLVRLYELPITPPTLSKLIRYYEMMCAADEGALRNTMRSSLFPAWLNKSIQYQDCSKWIYVGKMPVGKWRRVRPKIKPKTIVEMCE